MSELGDFVLAHLQRVMKYEPDKPGRKVLLSLGIKPGENVSELFPTVAARALTLVPYFDKGLIRELGITADLFVQTGIQS
ncbi:MAG: hypothetical protein JST85_22525 [Acidobacteria bacterium]|nr:hypothetical protein [Acidobacteriota bacterium]